MIKLAINLCFLQRTAFLTNLGFDFSEAIGKEGSRRQSNQTLTRQQVETSRSAVDILLQYLDEIFYSQNRLIHSNRTLHLKNDCAITNELTLKLKHVAGGGDFLNWLLELNRTKN